MSRITVTKGGIYKEIEKTRLAEFKEKGFIELDEKGNAKDSKTDKGAAKELKEALKANEELEVKLAESLKVNEVLEKENKKLLEKIEEHEKVGEHAKE